MRVPSPVCCAALTSARNSGCEYSSVCLATLVCSLFQAPDPVRSRESFCGVFGRGPRRCYCGFGGIISLSAGVSQRGGAGRKQPRARVPCPALRGERDLADACCHSSFRQPWGRLDQSKIDLGCLPLFGKAQPAYSLGLPTITGNYSIIRDGHFWLKPFWRFVPF